MRSLKKLTAEVDDGRPSQHLWHPFADMSRVIGEELVVDRGAGVWVFDAEGRRYLDASAGLWFCNVGHGRAALADAAMSQMKRLAAYQTFDRFANRPALQLAERVARLAPASDAAVFFTNGGSDAIDTAGKIARQYWSQRGESQRRIIVSREGAYHGVNAYGTSLSGIPANKAGWGSLVTGTEQVPRDDVDALERVLDRNRGRVAAFIGEPVQGAAGVYPPPPGYWSAVQALCRKHGVLVILDEVVTGFGRLGTWFAAERYEINADLILVAKGLSSGYLPIGAVIAASSVTDVLWTAQAGAFRHGYTYSGHPTACAVALANLDIIESEGLLQRVRELEPVLAGELGALSGHRLVQEVRTAGLLGGVELSAEAIAADPLLVDRVVAGARERGVLVRGLVGRTVQVSPPFIVEPAQLALIATTLRAALDEAVERASGTTVPVVA
jgi:putrescine aminotransferase